MSSSESRVWPVTLLLVVVARVARWYIYMPKIPIVGTFYGSLERNMFVYLRPFSIFCDRVCNILCGNCVILPILVCCTQKNLATLVVDSAERFQAGTDDTRKKRGRKKSVQEPILHTVVSCYNTTSSLVRFEIFRFYFEKRSVLCTTYNAGVVVLNSEVVSRIGPRSRFYETHSQKLRIKIKIQVHKCWFLWPFCAVKTEELIENYQIHICLPLSGEYLSEIHE
jgi:hypothetical protein